MFLQKLRNQLEQLKRPQIRITCIYVVVGCAWIYFSDALIQVTFQSSEAITTAQSYKGWFFIAFTAAILYLLLKQHFEAREAQHQRLRDVVDATETATWEWNVQTGETRFSERWAQIIGYRLEELEPTSIATWIDNCHPDDLAHSDDLLQAHLTGKSDFYVHEARMKHKTGSWVWVLDRGRVVEWDDEGKPLWMYGTHQDISERKNTEKFQTEALERIRKLTDQVPGGIYQYQQWPDGRATLPFASQGLRSIYGIDTTSDFLDPAEVFRRIHPDDLNKVTNSIQESFERLETWNSEHRAIIDGSKTVWLEGQAQPERQPDGSVLWHGYLQDVTRRKEHDAKLREAANVFKFANEGIFLTALDGTILDVNETFTQITGYARAEVIGQNPRILNSGRHDTALWESMFEALEHTGKWSAEVWNKRRNGEEFAVKQTVSVVRNEEGEPLRYLSLFSDITTLNRTTERLRRLAHSDPLTGLPNRSELTNQLAAAIDRSLQTATPLAVAYIDLDGFKAINDDQGHLVGDKILKDVAERLAASFRQSDLLGRIGGDEFVAIIENVPQGEAMNRIMERVLEDMRIQFSADKHSFQLSASIGVSWLPAGEVLDGDQLIRQADQAMYQAKQAGRNCYCEFDAQQDFQVRQVHSLVGEVRKGLEREEFCLVYQPKVNMKTGLIIGTEALIRWQHPHRGFLTPYHFLPDIAGQAVMEQLGFWVLNKASEQICRWKKAGRRVPVSVNIDGYTLLQPGFVDALRGCLKLHPCLQPGDLEIEVLETSAIQDMERVQSVMRECAALGFCFSIDDFGTGYSSLTYLKNLPASVLKIDTSFVRDMLSDPHDLSILYGILGLAKSFDRQCIAEGVETFDHGLLLLACGCELGQGYSIAKPMPASDFLDWAGAWQPPELWRNQEELADSKTAALFAFVEHNAWMLGFKQFLSNPTNVRPVFSEAECSLGKWIAKCSVDNHPGPALPQSLMGAHRNLHQCALRLIKAVKGSTEPAPAESFHEIERSHWNLVSELEAYLKIRLQSLH